MNSLSTNTFSPVAFSLGLLLVMTAVFPTLVPRGEDSKDDTTSNRPPLTSSEQIENLISTLLEISDVKNKMCDNHESCKNSKEAPTENNPNLPKLNRKDGCFHSGFNQETCLRRLTTGLLEFQVYLEYLQNTFEGHAQAMKTGTKALVNILRQKMKNPIEATIPDPTTNTGLLEKMHAQKKWLKTTTTTIHLILRSLEDFQQFTQRAIWM